MRVTISVVVGVIAASVVVFVSDTFFGVANDPILAHRYESYRLLLGLVGFAAGAGFVLYVWPRRARE